MSIQRYVLAVVGLLMGFVVTYIAAPVLMLSGLVAALRDADVEAFPRYIDFPAVRASLAEQVMLKLAADPRNRNDAEITAKRQAFIRMGLDEIITPSQLAYNINLQKKRTADAGEQWTKPGFENMSLKSLLNHLSIRGISEFYIVPSDTSAFGGMELIFHNNGILRWKLVGVHCLTCLDALK